MNDALIERLKLQNDIYKKDNSLLFKDPQLLELDKKDVPKDCINLYNDSMEQLQKEENDYLKIIEEYEESEKRAAKIMEELARQRDDSKAKLENEMTRNYFNKITVKGFIYSYIIMGAVLVAAIYMWIAYQDKTATGLLEFILGSATGVIGTVTGMNHLSNKYKLTNKSKNENE